MAVPGHSNGQTATRFGQTYDGLLFGGARVVPTRSGCARPDRVKFFQTGWNGHALRAEPRLGIRTIRAPETGALRLPGETARWAMKTAAAKIGLGWTPRQHANNLTI